MKTKCTKTLAVLTASLLSLSVAGQAAKDKESKSKKRPTGTSRGVEAPLPTRANRDILPMSSGATVTPRPTAQFRQTTPKQESTPKKKQSNRARTNHIDLRSKLASTRLHDGPNLVHSGDGVKLMAEARNNKIVGWSATNDKGNKLPTTVEKDSAGNVTGVQITGRPQTVVFRISRPVISR